MKIKIIPVPGFSEPFSCWSHLLTAGAGLVGMYFLLRRGRGNFWRQSSLFVYSGSLVFLFSMSGVYHLLEPGGVARMVLQRLDHAAIWILVAGTATPIHVILFRGFWRWGMLTLIWSLAITGLVLKTIFFSEVPDWLSLTFYICLGWMGVISGWRFMRTFGQENCHFLIGGGVAYTLGALLEFLQWPVIWPGVIGPHEVFHIFVILGAGLHWSFIYRWAAHPVINHLHVRVRSIGERKFIAKTEGESIQIEASSLNELKTLLQKKITEKFHLCQQPVTTRLSFTYEEIWTIE